MRLKDHPEAHETVYAVASGMGRAAVSVVRVSGPACSQILETLCPGTHFIERRATLARIIDRSGRLIDRGMIIYFCTPRSFTGEDVVEFQVTGSHAVVSILLQTLSTFPASRPAEAGEFTKRSFENGKRDLAEVEGLAAIVEAETVLQLRNAHRSATGELSRECEKVREGLLSSLALMESLLDFSDVEDPGATSLDDVVESIASIAARTKMILENSAALARLRDGLTVVIAGPPNVGKSTLMNILTRRDVSIVSDYAGTTRDLVEASIDMAGVPVVFVDTAGIRESQDPVESEGIRRALKRRETADLTLLLSSCLDDDHALDDAPSKQNVLRVRTKCDLAPNAHFSSEDIRISAKNCDGVGMLLEKITNFAHAQLAGAADSLITSERQRAAVKEAESALNRYLAAPNTSPEAKIEELRLAARCMGRVVGRIDVEEVLGSVFSRLCVGK